MNINEIFKALNSINYWNKKPAFDMGFGNYLFPALQKDMGSILENVVYSHLRIAGYEVKVGMDSNFEVNFVAEKSQRKQHVQVSYVMPDVKTQDREFGALEKIKDNLPKMVVSMDNLLVHDESVIMHQHVWNYIYDLSLETN